MTEETTLLKQISEWTSLLQIPIWGIVAWGWWSLKKIFVRQSDCSVCRSDMEKRQDELSRRQDDYMHARQALEQRLSGLPTVHDMHRIALAVSEMSGDVKRVGSEVEGLRVEQAHMREQFNDLLQLHMKPGA